MYVCGLCPTSTHLSNIECSAYRGVIDTDSQPNQTKWLLDFVCWQSFRSPRMRIDVDGAHVTAIGSQICPSSLCQHLNIYMLSVFASNAFRIHLCSVHWSMYIYIDLIEAFPLISQWRVHHVCALCNIRKRVLHQIYAVIKCVMAALIGNVICKLHFVWIHIYSSSSADMNGFAIRGFRHANCTRQIYNPLHFVHVQRSIRDLKSRFQFISGQHGWVHNISPCVGCCWCSMMMSARAVYRDALAGGAHFMIAIERYIYSAQTNETSHEWTLLLIDIVYSIIMWCDEPLMRALDASGKNLFCAHLIDVMKWLWLLRGESEARAGSQWTV